MFFSINKRIAQKMSCQLFWLVVLITHFCVFNVAAQNKKSNAKYFDTCETGKTSLFLAVEDFNKNAKPNSYLVIIGGAMKGEKSSYNNRRIQQSIGYINYNFKLGDRKVYGVGKSETNAGYLRFYVNGVRLNWEIITRKNAKLCWGEGDEMKFKTNSINSGFGKEDLKSNH
jgi:hypothetical protein